MNIAKKHSPTIVNILKKEIESIIRSKLITLYFDFRLKDISIDVERSKSAQHGDYCTNVAITLIKDPEVRMLFASSVAELLPFKIVKIAEVAPNGFINMFINEQCLDNAVKEVLKQKNKFGQFKKTSNFYNIEFVSANPTGLLHIGHARNAAIGDVLSRVCQCYGISINKEYYINDAGNQIDKLGLSLLIRYKQKLGKHDELPEDSYHGQEIT
jgi:arginyl-tRNA synthetase